MSSRLLIVDDSPVMRSFVKRIIAMSGFPTSEIREASNGQEALAQVRTSDFDLVLTDINMPVMDGEQLIREMKKDARLSSIPVVVVSTDATQNRVGTLMQLGAKGYLTKPFPPERLCEVLEEIVGVGPQAAERD